MATKAKYDLDGVFFEGGSSVHFGFEGDTQSKITSVKDTIGKGANTKGQSNLRIELTHQGKIKKGAKLIWEQGMSGSLDSGAKKADVTLSSLARGLATKPEEVQLIFKRLVEAAKKGGLAKELVGKTVHHAVADEEVMNPKTKKMTGKLRTVIPIGGMKPKSECDFDGIVKSDGAAVASKKSKKATAEDDEDDLPIEDEEETAKDDAEAEDEDEDEEVEEEEEEEE